MSQLTDNQRQLLKLIRRSTPNEEGWYTISDIVWVLFADKPLPAELVIVEKLEVGGRLKLTHAGGLVVAYL
jgi:hypothetical protein